MYSSKLADKYIEHVQQQGYFRLKERNNFLTEIMNAYNFEVDNAYPFLCWIELACAKRTLPLWKTRSSEIIFSEIFDEMNDQTIPNYMLSCKDLAFKMQNIAESRFECSSNEVTLNECAAGMSCASALKSLAFGRGISDEFEDDQFTDPEVMDAAFWSSVAEAGKFYWDEISEEDTKKLIFYWHWYIKEVMRIGEKYLPIFAKAIRDDN